MGQEQQEPVWGRHARVNEGVWPFGCRGDVVVLLCNKYYGLLNILFYQVMWQALEREQDGNVIKEWLYRIVNFLFNPSSILRRII